MVPVAIMILLVVALLPGAVAHAATSVSSDEFSSTALDPKWRFVDPVGDGSLTLNGSHAVLSVPAGVSHDVWGKVNRAPRLVQSTPDVDLDVVVRFDSPVTERFQMQGLLALQDAANLVRFDVFHDGSTVRVFAATFLNGKSTTKLNKAVSLTSPVFLRMARAGDTWTVSHSADGAAWTVAGTFSHQLTLTEIGPFVGNASPAPAMSAELDHFRVLTSDSVAPAVQDVAADAGTHAATVTWTTDEPASSTVQYGTGTAYGQQAHDGTLVTSHSLTLDGLACETTHHYRVLSTDAAGNTATSPDHTVTTQACPPPDNTPPAISGVTANADAGSVTVAWTTEEPASSTVQYGTGTAYGQQAHDGTLVTSHSLTLDGLACETTHHYRVLSTDAAGNTATSPDHTVTTQACPPESGLQSDDFSGTALAPVWRHEDSVGDGLLTLTGTNAALYVPRSPHDLWAGTNTVPKLLQRTPDADLDVTVRFESAPRYKTQIQGIVAQRDAADLVRFDVFHDGKSARVFAATIRAGTSSVKVNKAVALGPSVLLRVTRTGDHWTLRHSPDGTTWTVAGSFSHPLGLTEIGPFVGNVSGSPFVASVDYFESASDPLADDDGGQPPVTTDGPAIDLWYGEDQRVGHVGLAQQWFNVLGGVSDPDGAGALRYRLNGGPSTVLPLGPDGLRLARDGDFNAEIDLTTLPLGSNTVELEAMDVRGDYSTARLTLRREEGTSPALPYAVRWATATSIQDVAHVVDGQWSMDGGAVRTVQPGYDRLVAVGSRAWTAYEVTVPIVIHRVDGAVGLITGWTGHTGASSPRTGHPYGALGWYDGSGRLELRDRSVRLMDSQARTLEPGSRNLFKMRMEPLGDGTSRYRLKVWPQGTVEPLAWDVSATLPTRAGSTLLVAHHADAEFGDVSFTPLS